MIKKCIIVFMFLCSACLYALQDETAPPLTEPEHAYWIFSGTVANENGERFGYFFQMQKQNDLYHVKAGLMDAQTHQLIFYYNEEQQLSHEIKNKWNIGRAFLHFNAINESWVFGVKMKDKQGFNFKVDLLNQNPHHTETQTLSPGVDLFVYQTNKLNGHLQTTKQEKEQFVTANNAWFSKVWLSLQQQTPHFLTSGFCRFDDGSGFYTENLQEKDAKRSALASWRDALGNAAKMSQFVSIQHREKNIWTLKVSVPKLALELTNVLADEATASDLVAGFFKNNHPGFCFFTNQKFYNQEGLHA